MTTEVEVIMAALTALIIDTDESRRSVVLAFQEAGFQVSEALESGQGVRSTLDASPHIILVGEEMLPPMNGVELLPLLRHLTDVPIIVVGAGGEMAMVQALLGGADLYLSRPVNLRECMARVQALLRRYGSPRGTSGEPLLQCW